MNWEKVRRHVENYGSVLGTKAAPRAAVEVQPAPWGWDLTAERTIDGPAVKNWPRDTWFQQRRKKVRGDDNGY